tara:strand:- start:5044 stop:5310 length:267 start_codon:yes stop_codon:yes gene_type:complete
MTPKTERYVILILFIILLFAGLNGCANKTSEIRTADSGSSISKMQSIADVLGCMFAPNECKKIKEEEQQQEEITEGFEEVDKEKENEK